MVNGEELAKGQSSSGQAKRKFEKQRQSECENAFRLQAERKIGRNE